MATSSRRDSCRKDVHIAGGEEQQVRELVGETEVVQGVADGDDIERAQQAGQRGHDRVSLKHDPSGQDQPVAGDAQRADFRKRWSARRQGHDHDQHEHEGVQRGQPFE